MQRWPVYMAGLMLAVTLGVLHQKPRHAPSADKPALSDGCGITNDAAPFRVLIEPQPAGEMRLRWESCSTHVYGMYVSGGLAQPHQWIVDSWRVGADGLSSWLDTNAAAWPCRFYRVRRLPGQADADADGVLNQEEVGVYRSDPINPDTDGDGLPDGWEARYGLELLVAALPTTDTDGDGVGDQVEYLQGRNPTVGAVADQWGILDLAVYTPQE